jgi:hypothetical protein
MNLSFHVNNITISRVVFSMHASWPFTRLTRSFDLCFFTLGKSQKKEICTQPAILVSLFLSSLAFGYFLCDLKHYFLFPEFKHGI